MRRVAVVLCAFLLALMATGTSSAQRAEHITLDNNFTFIGGFISARCGFDVTVTLSGTLDVTLFYDESGNIVREIDQTPAGLVTFTGPTGRSVTYSTAGNAAFFNYPEGAFIGAPAIVEFQGDWSHTPGVFLGPGAFTFRSTVVDFIEPEHVPLTIQDELIESHGKPVSQGENMDAICSAISP
jgi:hypothetical protein